MREQRRSSRTQGWTLALTLLAASAPAMAGSGRLLSGWMTQVPAINGELSPGEWNEASAIDIAPLVTARLGNDGRTLYVLVVDARPGEPAGDRMILFFDDETGAAPALDDGVWTNPDCQQDPALGEGEIWFHFDGGVGYYEWRSSWQFCPMQEVSDLHRSAVGAQVGVGVVYEAAIPLDGAMPLHGTPGQRIGLQLRAVDAAGAGEVCYPACDLDPAAFRNVILATPRCNVGAETFDATPAMPLEWSASVPTGSGTGWMVSGVLGDPETCGANGTVGAGAAACVANGAYGSTASVARLRMPLDVSGQQSATLFFQFAFVQGDPADRLSFGYEYADGSTSTTLSFDFSWPPPGGATGANIPIPAGNVPVAAWFAHSTQSAGGTEGGFADLDDVRVICNPFLFADYFETGLTTHWSSETP